MKHSSMGAHLSTFQKIIKISAKVCYFRSLNAWFNWSISDLKEREGGREAAAQSFHWMEVKTGSETITPLTKENKYTFIQKDHLISLGLGIRSVDYLNRSPVSINPASPRRNKLRTCTFQDHSTFTVLKIAKKKKLGVKLHLCSQTTYKASCKSATPQGRQAVNYLSFCTATHNHHGGGNPKRSRDFSKLPTSLE